MTYSKFNYNDTPLGGPIFFTHVYVPKILHYMD